MSICRWIGDSDVYAYGTDDYGTEGFGIHTTDGRSFSVATATELLRLLLALRDTGLTVPQHAIDYAERARLKSTPLPVNKSMLVDPDPPFPSLAVRRDLTFTATDTSEAPAPEPNKSDR